MLDGGEWMERSLSSYPVVEGSGSAWQISCSWILALFEYRAKHHLRFVMDQPVQFLSLLHFPC